MCGGVNRVIEGERGLSSTLRLRPEGRLEEERKWGHKKIDRSVATVYPDTRWGVCLFVISKNNLAELIEEATETSEEQARKLENTS